MKPSAGSTALPQLARLLWAATLVTIPVTSFRYFPAGEGTYVRPLSFLPLVFLLVVLGVRLTRGELDFPRVSSLTPLFAFLLMAVLASAAGVLLIPIPLRGQDAAARIVRAWVTILMGTGFFVGALWMNRDESDVRFSVRWLLFGFILDVLWSGLQAATFYLHLLPKTVVTQWQRAFSLRELIRTNRISGLAYEPSWLAAQIATVYLPWLVAGVLARVHVFRRRWLHPVLLALAGLMLLATFSRGGILTAVASIGLALAFAGGPEIRAVWHWFAAARSGLAAAVVRAAVVAAALLALGAAGQWLAQKGYVSRLWESRSESLTEFLVQNSAGARAAYSVSALQTYQDHPLTGVGPGASGLYMYARFPDWALTSVPEVARQLSPDSSLYPNPKNLYLRLLAETGLPGLILFGAFLMILLADAVLALSQGPGWWRFVGLAGLLTWFAVLIFNVTQDSFATPNLWINLGILSGLIGASRMRRTKRPPASSRQSARRPASVRLAGRLA